MTPNNGTTPPVSAGEAETKSQGSAGRRQDGTGGRHGLDQATDPATEAYAAACWWISQGQRVFPTSNKKPLVNSWPTDAARTPAELQRQWPAGGSEYAIVCGEIVVVDQDRGGEESLAELQRELGPAWPRETWVCKTPGGTHYYMKRPPGIDVARRIGIRHKVDLLGHGGYAIGHGSTRPDGGRYELVTGPEDCPIATVPDELLALIAPPKAGPSRSTGKTPTGPDVELRARAYLAKMPPAIQGQYGSGALYDAALAMVKGFALPVSTALELLEADYNSRCDPPWSDKELRHKVDDAGASSKVPTGYLLEGARAGTLWASAHKVDPSAPFTPRETSTRPAEPLPFAPLTPLDRDHDLPAFPTSALPRDLARFVEAVAESLQAPADLPGCMVLAVLATAAAKRVQVKPMDDWTEPVNLYLVVALAPGNLKSGVAREVARPLRKIERDLLEAAAPAIRDREIERRVLSKSKERLEKEAGKADDEGERAAIVKEMKEIAAELESKPAILPPRLVADDATAETVVRMLAEQGGRIANISGESDAFEIWAGRYSDGAPNIGVFLSGHAGDDIRVDRMGRPPLRVDEPAISLGICTQPHVVRGLADSPAFKGRGLLDRLLYAIPVSPLGTRRLDTTPIPSHVRATYDGIIESIFNTLGPPDGKPPAVLYLTPDARRLFQGFRAEVEPEIGQEGQLGHVAGWGSKLPGAVARIAGLLHVATHADRRPPERIEDATMAAAIDLGRYFRSHAIAAFDLMGVDEAIADARQVATWLGKGARSRFTAAEARVDLRGQLKTAGRVEKALDVLVDHGWIRVLTGDRPLDRNGQHRGRVPATFEVNSLSNKTRNTGRTPCGGSSGLPGSSGEGSSFHRAGG